MQPRHCNFPKRGGGLIVEISRVIDRPFLRFEPATKKYISGMSVEFWKGLLHAKSFLYSSFVTEMGFEAERSPNATQSRLI